MQEIYNNEASANSMALDILSVYLKGQKILYIEAKSYCEVRLNALMLPAIVISAATTVLVAPAAAVATVANIASCCACQNRRIDAFSSSRVVTRACRAAICARIDSANSIVARRRASA